MINDIKFFLVDFDGTIANTEDVFDDFDGKFLNEFLFECKIEKKLSNQEVRNLAGIAFSEKIDLISKQFSANNDKLRKKIIEDRETKRQDLFADIAPQLASNIDIFTEKFGDKSAIVTNKTKEKYESSVVLIRHICDRFAYRVCLSEDMQRKPAPDLLYKAMNLLGADPKLTAYIGDNAIDIQAAINAGVIPIGFIIEGLHNNRQKVQELKSHGALAVIDDFAYFTDYRCFN